MNKLRARSRSSTASSAPSVAATTTTTTTTGEGAAATAAAAVEEGGVGGGGAPPGKARSSSTTGMPAEGIQRRRSLAKADNLAVALSGGTTKSKHGTLKKKNSTIFGTSYTASFVKVDNGDLVFALNEDALSYDDDESKIKKHSLFEIRELKLVAPGSSEFQIKLGLPESKSSIKTVVLRAESNEEALEWIETLKHEIKNQVLVYKSMAQVLSEKGKPERAEPLFQQSIDALSVAYGADHIEVSDSMKSYAVWLNSQNRSAEAKAVKDKAKSIARAYYAANGGGSASDGSDTEDTGVSPKAASSASAASSGGGGGGAASNGNEDNGRGRVKSWRLGMPPRPRSASRGRPSSPSADKS